MMAVAARDMFLAAHSKAGRALLGWSQEQLAKKAGLSLSTVRNFEKGRSDPYSRNRDAIERALLDAGVEILDPGAASLDGGIGVRLKAKKR
jgi:transcriptional regulator with XRE-family HTH domain